MYIYLSLQKKLTRGLQKKKKKTRSLQSQIHFIKSFYSYYFVKTNIFMEKIISSLEFP